MPEPTKFSKPKAPDSTEVVPAVPAVEEIVVTQCHVCASSYRRAIDKMLALGTPYTEISRIFGEEISRKSIANHAKEHLTYEDEAIRRLVANEVEAARESMEEGVSAAVSRRVYLQTLLHKAQEAMVLGDTPPEPKDALAAIQLLDKLDMNREATVAAELEIQMHAFITAIKEIVPEEMYYQILDRTKEIAGSVVNEPKQIAPSTD